MVKFLKLIRWPNLLIIALVQYLLRFSLIEALNIPHALNHTYYALGVLCAMCLAAAGFIINDLYDQANDLINKPNRVTIGKGISESLAWNGYFAFTVVAIVSGYLLANYVDLEGLWMIPVLATVLLYLYALDLKKRPVLGNLIVALLAALPVFLVAVFDILPTASPENAVLIKQVFEVIVGYSLFAFWLTFIREIVKDAQDIEGDAQLGFQTLAILLGRQNIKWVIAALALALLAFSLWFNSTLYPGDLISSTYVLLFVNLPLLYFFWGLYRANTAADFRRLSTLLKLIIITGILSMVVFTYAIKNSFI